MAPVCGTMFSSAACNSPVGLRVAHTNLQSAGLIKVLNRLSGYVSNIYIKGFCSSISMNLNMPHGTVTSNELSLTL